MDKSEFNKLLGEAIRKLRTSKGLSQQDLASEMNINFQNISAVERGEVSPTLFWISKLCECLEIELSQFVKELE